MLVSFVKCHQKSPDKVSVIYMRLMFIRLVSNNHQNVLSLESFTKIRLYSIVYVQLVILHVGMGHKTKV